MGDGHPYRDMNNLLDAIGTGYNEISPSFLDPTFCNYQLQVVAFNAPAVIYFFFKLVHRYERKHSSIHSSIHCGSLSQVVNYCSFQIRDTEMQTSTDVLAQFF